MVALSPTRETVEAETGIVGETKSSQAIPHVGRDGIIITFWNKLSKK